ncbi:ATP-binding protein [Peribacillus frigoritolerans]|uniref:ATP-binding protein n=1 Tax=Peribacillus frigoritolerans TaxID=450367 RepID=UPI003871CD39
MQPIYWNGLQSGGYPCVAYFNRHSITGNRNCRKFGVSMDLLTKDLLINFLLILLPLLFLQMLFLKNFVYKHELIRKWLFVFFSLTSIFLCVRFPFPQGEFILDLSAIPFILGVLYGGNKLIIVLIFWSILNRYLMGDEGVLIAFISLSFLAIMLLFLTKYYIQLSLKQKVMVSSSLIIILITVALFISNQVYWSFMGIGISLKYIAINVICMVVTTILLEVIRMNIEVLQKVIKAEKLDVVSHLAASISHEVKNPLTASKGYIQLALDREISFQQREDYLGIAVKELDNAAEIINDYLTFAKPAIEKKEKIIIFQEIKKAVKVLSPLAKMNNVQIRSLIETEEPHFIIGERKKFEQCLINILKNGIESMPNGGKLYVDLEIQYPMIKITIQDEGMGMTQEQINRLGEPYFSTKVKGTGLGMMVSYSIVNGMGGDISVASEPSVGTCFSINFQTTNFGTNQ